MSYSSGSLGQVTVTPSAPLSDGAKIGVGLGAFALLGGLGYLAWKFPTPMFGGGLGYGYGYGGPGITFRMNGRRRR